MPEARRRGRPRSERARRAILQATAELMMSTGYDALTIDAIADRASVGRQTIYRWWPGKASIVAEAALEGVLQPFRAPAPGIELEDVVHVLVAQLRVPENAALVRALTAAAAGDPDDANALYDRGTRAAHAALTDAVRRSQDDGRISQHLDADAMADAIIGSVLYRILARVAIPDDYAERLLRSLR